MTKQRTSGGGSGSNRPTTQNDETRLLLKGILPGNDARYRLKDVATGKLVRVHGSSVQWKARSSGAGS